MLIVLGGTLLLTPGFLTDIFGLFLLIPPTRAIARRVLRRLTIGRFTVVGNAGQRAADRSEPRGPEPDPTAATTTTSPPRRSRRNDGERATAAELS